MLFFSNKIQVLLNTWVTSSFEDTQYFSTVCNIKGQDHNLHLSWGLILNLAIIRDLLRNLAVFPLSIKMRLNVLYCSGLSAFCMASWECPEHCAELVIWNTLLLMQSQLESEFCCWNEYSKGCQREEKYEKHLWSWYWQEGLWAFRELLVARVQKNLTTNFCIQDRLTRTLKLRHKSKQLSLAVQFLLYLSKPDFLRIILWINIIQEMLYLSLLSLLNRNKSHNASLG